MKVFQFFAVLGLVIFGAAPHATGADVPNMSQVWRLDKTTWGGSCAGKWTRLYTMDVTECNAAKSFGYKGSASSCNPNENFSADHYLSTVPFPGSVDVYRLVFGGTCGNCKDTFVLTTSINWKSELMAGGWKHEKTYYGWNPSNLSSLMSSWGLVPVYHAYSSTMCDNFYSEHPNQMANVTSQGYGPGPAWEPKYNGYTVAYVASDGRLNLTVKCSGVSNCTWSLTGPGGEWSVNGSGTKSYNNLPTHKYVLKCDPISGMTVSSSPPNPIDLEYFSTSTITCVYTCINQCSQGQKNQCASASSVQSCVQNNQGCWVWSSPQTCNDSNPCTDDLCSNGTCSPSFNFLPCEDNNPCTVSDQCQNGSCKPGFPKNCEDNNPCTNDACSGGQCTNIGNFNPCNDNNPCTQNDACSGGQCIGNPMVCNDNNPCTNDACAGGQCQYSPNTSPCDDKNVCTSGDVCANGSCKSGSPITCSDGNPCTQDTCVPATGCVYPAVSGACNDNNVCTTGDSCQGGICLGGAVITCNDNNPCTNDTCQQQAGCTYTPNNGPCNDNNDCTSNDTCSGGQCQGQTTICNDQNPCTTDECQNGKGCVYTPKNALCNDDNPCTDDVCGTAGCTFKHNTMGCSDNNPCTVSDQCVEGICVSGPQNPCNDGIMCTVDACAPQSGCTHEPNHTQCADNVACTDEVCVPNKGCEPVPQNTECDDKNPCTTEFCDVLAGCIYQDQGAVVCDDKNPCTTDVCSVTDGCQYLPLTGVGCEDGDFCTVKDLCAAGICTPGGPKCNDGNPCTADVCDKKSGACQNQPADGLCDDQNQCTVGDECVAGQCKGNSTLPCADGNPCTDDTCDPLLGCQAVPNGAPCSDGDPCTEGDVCKEGGCVPGLPKICDDNNACTQDQCADAGQCKFVPTVGKCDDGNACTQEDQCKDGLCAGTPVLDCCSTATDCVNPQPECLNVSCSGGICKTTPFCPETACGPNPCDETMHCGDCFAFETCVSGACYETCAPAEKNVTRCANDSKTLEKCTVDESSGATYWKPTDCVAQGEAGCAFSKDKNLFVCCTPNCEDKQCGTPSACGMSCGTCGAGEICCELGQPCDDANISEPFECIDCCWNQECGPALEPGCNTNCGTCSDGKTCKQGQCVGTCEEQGITESGQCVGKVAWWCDLNKPNSQLQTVDCAEYGSTCCNVQELGHVGCCTCEGECEKEGWQCGTDSCGNPCGDNNGDCPVGSVCVNETQQCLCTVPEFCAPDTENTGCTDGNGGDGLCSDGNGGNADTDNAETNPGKGDAGAGDAGSTENQGTKGGDEGCSCSSTNERSRMGDVGWWAVVVFFVVERVRRKRVQDTAV